VDILNDILKLRPHECLLVNAPVFEFQLAGITGMRITRNLEVIVTRPDGKKHSRLATPNQLRNVNVIDLARFVLAK